MKWLEGLKWRWWLANHEHDWEYRSGIVGIHYLHGAYTTKTCKDPQCRQIETIYVSSSYDTLGETKNG